MDKANKISQQQENFAQIVLPVLQEDGSVLKETLWAVDLGDDQYRLRNIPVLPYSVSWGDIVYAPAGSTEDDGWPVFQRVIQKSGNRTIRIAFGHLVKEEIHSHVVLQELLALGCTSEGGIGSLVCVNIPPDVDLGEIVRGLRAHKMNFEIADLGQTRKTNRKRRVKQLGSSNK